MKVKNKNLFEITDLNDYISSFNTKINDLNAKIESIDKDLEKIEVDYDQAIEKDVLESSAKTKAELTNIHSRQLNLETQKNDEIEKLKKIKDIMQAGLAELIPTKKEQIDKDLSIFLDTVEKDIYRQLSEVRQKQEELLLLLEKAHKIAENEIYLFNNICIEYGFKQYFCYCTGWHINLYMAHPRFPYYRQPLINCWSLPAVEDRIMHENAEAIGRNTNPEDTAKFSKSLTLEDVDLGAFLKTLT